MADNKNKPDFSDTRKFDGVEYTPSKRPAPPPQNGVVRKRTAAKPARRRVSSQKSQFSVFFMTTIFIAAVVALIAFAMIYKTFTSEQSGELPIANVSPTPGRGLSSSPPLISEIPKKEGQVVATALVTAISQSDRTLILYDFELDRSYSLNIDEKTVMKDKYGKAMYFPEFTMGEIVDASFDPYSGLLSELRTSARSWSFKAVTGMKIDTAAMTANYGLNSYSYTEKTIVTYNDTLYNISSVDTADVVDIKGSGNLLLGIVILRGHGSLLIPKMEETPLLNGLLEIDTTATIGLDSADEQKVSVSEGEHKIVIKAANIEPFVKNITITRGETFELDPSELKFLSGKMSFAINEPDAKLSINGALRPNHEPVELPFGAYTIVVEKDGFTRFEQLVDFRDPNYEVTATLEKYAQICNLLVSTTPPGANVFIDNVLVGISPVEIPVEYGIRTISVRKSGYVEITFPVNIASASQAVPIELRESSTIVTPDVGGVPVG